MKVFKLLNRGYKRLRNLERYWSPRQCQHYFDHVIKTNSRNKYCLKFSCKFLLEHYFRTFLGVRAHSYGLRLDEAIKIKYKMSSFTSILKCSSTTHISSGLEWKTIDTKHILTVPTEWIRWNEEGNLFYEQDSLNGRLSKQSLQRVQLSVQPVDHSMDQT